MNLNLLGVSILALVLAWPALAAVELVTPDGRRVLLNDDYTWEYLSPAESRPRGEAGQPRAVLRVSRVDEMEGDACSMGVVLQNDLPFKIKNLAIRFTAYRTDSIPYDHVTRSFFEIKTSDNQYRQVFFRGISCRDIHHIKVEDPGRCSMGQLDRFSSLPGDCIKHINVEPSELIRLRQ